MQVLYTDIWVHNIIPRLLDLVVEQSRVGDECIYHLNLLLPLLQTCKSLRYLILYSKYIQMYYFETIFKESFCEQACKHYMDSYRHHNYAAFYAPMIIHLKVLSARQILKRFAFEDVPRPIEVKLRKFITRTTMCQWRFSQFNQFHYWATTRKSKLKFQDLNLNSVVQWLDQTHTMQLRSMKMSTLIDNSCVYSLTDVDFEF